MEVGRIIIRKNEYCKVPDMVTEVLQKTSIVLFL